MEKRPLIHCITNYVAMDFTANALLAVGAVPLMSFCKEEMEEIVSKCDALSVNIGCLDLVQVEAMEIAVRTAKILGKPWVLDPVGYGFTKLRTETCNNLIDIYAPRIIRGNRREMTSEDWCRWMARRTGSVMVMSGETDFITDGVRETVVRGGDVKQTLVTAMGCSCSAVCAAFTTMYDDAFTAAEETMKLYAEAGREAAVDCEGTGSYKTKFIDAIYGKRRIEIVSGN